MEPHKIVGALIVTLVIGLVGGAVIEHEAPAVQEVEDFIVNAPASKVCPTGWQEESARDEHTVVISCTRGEWRVFLDREGQFSHGWNGVGDFEFDARRVPNWPAP